ncbi:MAG: hypothetical protein ACREU8_12440 [Gammaproteobacteria bacterium]
MRRLVIAVAWFELWGGVWGITASGLVVYRRANELSASFLSGIAVALLFFGTTAVAGYTLARDRPLGWRLSVPVLAFQVLQFTALGLSYAAYAGAQVTVGVSGWTLELAGDIGSMFRARPLDDASPFRVAVNLLALLALLGLVRAKALRTAARHEAWVESWPKA